jgi:hypothetical protein
LIFDAAMPRHFRFCQTLLFIITVHSVAARFFHIDCFDYFSFATFRHAADEPMRAPAMPMPISLMRFAPRTRDAHETRATRRHAGFTPPDGC